MSHTTADRVEFAHRAWPAHPLQLAPIRAETRRWLESLNLSDDAEQAFARAVEEAASNVVQRAYPPVPIGAVASDDAASHDVVELTFWTEDQTVCIEIVDHGRWQPPGATFNSRCCSRFAIMLESMQTVLIHYDIRGTRVLRSAV
jgi:anti-sigma regulatory factor (Ser/Thr protein kinase)